MRKGSDVVGLPVVTLAEAAKVGTVRDLVIDPSRRAVGALLVAEANQRQPSMEVSFEAVRRIGPDAVIIEAEADAVPIAERPRRQTLCEGGWRLLGLRVLTEGGRTVGRVADVVVDERSGRIESFLLSKGPLRDVISGRLSISASTPRSVGTEYMVVPESAVMGRRSQLEEGPPLVVEGPPGEIGELPVEEIERIAADVVARQEDLVIGVRARRAVANEDPGGVICYEGEPITEEIVERAKAAGKLNQLIQAAGEAASAALSRGLAEQYARVAVGRMAGRTVLTTEGDVVVAQGDVVTQGMVERAREAGVLDQLVEAVRVQAGEPTDRGIRGREAAQALWAQVGGGFGRLTRRRR
jgi:uncharacterized protein YrrD